MEKKDNETLETKKKRFDTDALGTELNIITSRDIKPLTTENRLMKELFECEMKPALSILCVERHQRTKVGYLTPESKACTWGEIRENATNCGDCPFGVKLMEYVPKNNTKEILRNLRREQDDAKVIYQ
jgi:hypothetical protein